MATDTNDQLAPPAGEAGAPGALRGVKVMLLDDDTFLLDMYGLKLKREGAEVAAYPSAQEALDKLADGYVPDVILCDIIMPQMDGLEFLKEVRAKGYAPKATVVVLSNQGQEIDQEQAAESKVDDYIIKALLTPSEVVARVAAAHAKHAKSVTTAEVRPRGPGRSDLS
ncbi:MAG TPA: response regulator [Candidatus Paceibacterota bacterium]